MTTLESIYKNILFHSVKATEMDFKRTVRASINRQKTTKLAVNEKLINALIDKIWLKFLEDIKNPRIGVINAIHNAFANKFE